MELSNLSDKKFKVMVTKTPDLKEWMNSVRTLIKREY